MSKKLIAIASAAALALTALVAVPANAAIAVAYADGAGAVSPATTSAAAAANLDVPANNELEFTSTAGRSSLLEVTVTTVAKDVVSATGTGAIKIVDDVVDAAGDPYKSNAGASSYTVTATTSTVVFYVYTTSTATGSLTITKGGNTEIVYFKGTAGEAYNLAVTFPANVPTSATADVTAQITDIFGNTAITSETATATGTGPGFASATSLTWDSGDENWQGTITGSAVAGPVAVTYSLANSPADVTGLAKAVKTAFKSMDAASLSAQITALNAQITALTAQLAASRPVATSVTKKKYNTLARKWNASNPSARVALKK